MRESYRTLAGPVQCEIERIHGSRFLGLAAPVTSTDAIEAELCRIRKSDHAAQHHCFAWRLGSGGERYRANDDGEPSGSAGRPILERIDALQLTDTLVVVTRYFGGVKLGIGGLSRAYSRAAEQVLAQASTRTVTFTRRFEVCYAYELSHAMQAWMGSLALSPTTADYGERIRLVFDVPIGQVDTFVSSLRERSAGRVVESELGADME
jgi:uncharacterized YigZ family protein